MVLGHELEDDEEVKKVLEMSTTSFVVCKSILDYPNTHTNSLLEQQCDHDIKFLRGLCESANNQYDYCTDTKMDSYLILRGQYDAPRPDNVWCNDFIDKCIELAEAAKEDAINQFGENDAANLIQLYDQMIEKLEDKKESSSSSEQD